MSLAEPDLLRRRARMFRFARIAVVALVVGYFFMPYSVQAVIPVWLLFLAALGLELEFFLGGYIHGRRAPVKPDRGPQPHDIAELGGARWQEELTPEEFDELVAEPVELPEPVQAAPFTWRYVAEALAALALVAGILYFASRPQGWDAVSSSDRARAEAAYSREATLIAGHKAQVGCDTSGQYVGFVQDADGVATVGGSQAYITPDICNTLYQVAFKRRVQSFSQTGRAIAVLAHESWHLHGVSDEGLTNCYAFQSGVQLGVHLGLSEGTARAMMREQLATNASDSGANIKYIVPSGCRDGGADDLKPDAPGFP